MLGFFTLNDSIRKELSPRFLSHFLVQVLEHWLSQGEVELKSGHARFTMVLFKRFRLCIEMLKIFLFTNRKFKIFYFGCSLKEKKEIDRIQHF